MSVNPGGFFGRNQVLATLADHLHVVTTEGTGRILAMRGRRQVGKSSVVERFLSTCGHPYAFVTGVYQAPTRRQLGNATAAITESARPFPDADLLTQSPAATWREWLGRIALASRSGPVVVVLDEFPWLTAADPALEGELQVQWDRTLEKLPVLMVLIGSDVEMMAQLGTHGRPLFGRLRPFVVPALNPAEVAEALPGCTAVQALDAYLVTGGYPRLVIDLARETGTVAADYVRAAMKDAYSPLVTTARLSLDAEFPEPQAAYQVLSAIGADESARPGFNDILGAMADTDERKRAETAITRALRTLTDTKRLVDRELPAWAMSSSKLRRYRISDPYLRFWFRYIERNVDRIARGRADLAVAAFDRDWPTWRGRVIEPVVREALERLATADPHLDGVESVRPWWLRDGSVEIDVVATTTSRTAMRGTVKWGTRGATERDIEVLRRQRERVPHAESALIAAISPDGRAPRGADIGYGANDVLSAWAG